MNSKVVIGITDCEKYPNYERWMLAERDVEVIRLGHQFSNLDDVARCGGILLTGGEDIHPRYYGKTTQYANVPDEFEEQRDEFEIGVLREAQRNHLPVLGICRGLQLINCVLGGTLQQDLGELNLTHTRISKDDKTHDVDVDMSTLFYKIVKENKGVVNSSHHQAIEKLGEGLKITCRANDGTVEGIEGTAAQSFLLAVQWHPERMADQHSPFSLNIKNAFLEEVRKIKI